MHIEYEGTDIQGRVKLALTEGRHYLALINARQLALMTDCHELINIPGGLTHP